MKHYWTKYFFFLFVSLIETLASIYMRISSHKIEVRYLSPICQTWRILCLKTRICNQGLNLVMFGETGKTKTVYSRFDYCSKELFFWTLECMEEVGYYGMYAFYCYNIGPLNPYTQSKSVINGVINWTLNSDTIFDLYMGLYFCLMKFATSLGRD